MTNLKPTTTVTHTDCLRFQNALETLNELNENKYIHIAVWNGTITLETDEYCEEFDSFEGLAKEVYTTQLVNICDKVSYRGQTNLALFNAFTNQGFLIVDSIQSCHPKGYAYVIVYRPNSNDFAIGIDYDFERGYWWQGRYGYNNVIDCRLAIYTREMALFGKVK